MPLLNHFAPPLSNLRPWDSFHSAWANAIALQLNDVLPDDYLALAQTSCGPMVEIDVGTFASSEGDAPSSTTSWKPQPPLVAGTIEWPERDLFEIRVYSDRDGSRLVGAIELVSPANKDRPSARRTFVGKCAGYLRGQVGLIVVDCVTTCRHNLHRELVTLLELDAAATEWDAGDPPLYAVAYCTRYDASPQLEIWPERLALYESLPTLPLWIAENIAVPVDLEASYAAACRRFRIDRLTT